MPIYYQNGDSWKLSPALSWFQRWHSSEQRTLACCFSPRNHVFRCYTTNWSLKNKIQTSDAFETVRSPHFSAPWYSDVLKHAFLCLSKYPPGTQKGTLFESSIMEVFRNHTKPKWRQWMKLSPLLFLLRKKKKSESALANGKMIPVI